MLTDLIHCLSQYSNKKKTLLKMVRVQAVLDSSQNLLLPIMSIAHSIMSLNLMMWEDGVQVHKIHLYCHTEAANALTFVLRWLGCKLLSSNMFHKSFFQLLATQGKICCLCLRVFGDTFSRHWIKFFFFYFTANNWEALQRWSVLLWDKTIWQLHEVKMC